MAHASLWQWLHAHADNPIPSHDETLALARVSGLSVGELANWFSFARRALTRQERCGAPSADGGCGGSLGPHGKGSGSNTPSVRRCCMARVRRAVLGPHPPR